MISIYSRNLSRTVPRLNCECKGTNFFYSTKLFFIFFENFFITTLITNTIFPKLFFAISLFFPGFLPKFDAFFPFLTYCMSFFTQNTCIALHISKINGFLSVFERFGTKFSVFYSWILSHISVKLIVLLSPIVDSLILGFHKRNNILSIFYQYRT